MYKANGKFLPHSVQNVFEYTALIWTQGEKVRLRNQGLRQELFGEKMMNHVANFEKKC